MSVYAGKLMFKNVDPRNIKDAIHFDDSIVLELPIISSRSKREVNRYQIIIPRSLATITEVDGYAVVELPESFDTSDVLVRHRAPGYCNLTPDEIVKKLKNKGDKSSFTKFDHNILDAAVNWTKAEREVVLATNPMTNVHPVSDRPNFDAKTGTYRNNKPFNDDPNLIVVTSVKAQDVKVNQDSSFYRDIKFILPNKDENGNYGNKPYGYSLMHVPAAAMQIYETSRKGRYDIVIDKSLIIKQSGFRLEALEGAYPGSAENFKKLRAAGVFKDYKGLFSYRSREAFMYFRAKTMASVVDISKDMKEMGAFAAANKELENVTPFVRIPSDKALLPATSVTAVVTAKTEDVKPKETVGKEASTANVTQRFLAPEVLVNAMVIAMDRWDKVAGHVLACDELADKYGVQTKDVTADMLTCHDYTGELDDVVALRAYRRRLNSELEALKMIRSDMIKDLKETGVPASELPIVEEEMPVVREKSAGYKNVIEAMHNFNTLRGLSLTNPDGSVVERDFNGGKYPKNIDGVYALSDKECDRLEHGQAIIATNVPNRSGTCCTHFKCYLEEDEKGNLKVMKDVTDANDPEFMDPDVNEDIIYHKEKWEAVANASSISGIEKFVEQSDRINREPAPEKPKVTHAFNGREALFLQLSFKGANGSKNSLKRRQETYDRLRKNPSSPMMRKLGFETEYDERRFVFGQSKVAGRVDDLDHILDTISKTDFNGQVDKQPLMKEKERLLGILDEYKTEQTMRETPPSDKGRKAGYKSAWEEKVASDYEELVAKLGNKEVVFDENAGKIVWRNERLKESMFIRSHGFGAHTAIAGTEKDERRKLGFVIPTTDSFTSEVPDFV